MKTKKIKLVKIKDLHEWDANLSEGRCSNFNVQDNLIVAKVNE